MAKDAKPAPVEGDAPKKSKKLLIIIIAVVLLLVIAGAGAAFLLMSKNSDHADDEEEVVDVKKVKKKKTEANAPPIFVNLDPFTVNLVPEHGDQYMQVVMALELEDLTSDATLKSQMPRVRNNLTMILSSKKASELVTKEGKELLAKELKNEINTIIDPSTRAKEPDGPVRSVLFTSFIIQ